MKRYRVLGFDLDSRSSLLGTKIEEHWEPAIKAQWERNKKEVRDEFIRTYGEVAAAQKIENLVDIGDKPFSVIAFHNVFLADSRDAFVVGAYYPALVGVCALGERVLNHLVLRLREYYRATPEYKAVYRKESFDNWGLAIRTLRSWGVLTEKAAIKFSQLEAIRNRAVHFHPDTDKNDRELGLEAIRTFQECMLEQFSGIGMQDWFIPDSPGEAYIRKKWEDHPFVREVYLPNCALVGPKHHLDLGPSLEFIVHDEHDYPETEVSDEEFVVMRKS